MELTHAWTAGFDERYPIYQQIMDRFSQALVRKELKPGDRVLSIREMAVALKVNNNTIQRAYQEMERLGIIYSMRGTGYFVMNDEALVERLRKEKVGEVTGRFLSEMAELGFSRKEILEQVAEAVAKGGEHDGIADN